MRRQILSWKVKFSFTSFPACFESYVYYAYLTQKHGGVAAIMKNPQRSDRLLRSIGRTLWGSTKYRSIRNEKFACWACRIRDGWAKHG